MGAGGGGVVRGASLYRRRQSKAKGVGETEGKGVGNDKGQGQATVRLKTKALD